jgi:hypothetical protein
MVGIDKNQLLKLLLIISSRTMLRLSHGQIKLCISYLLILQSFVWKTWGSHILKSMLLLKTQQKFSILFHISLIRSQECL